MTQDNTQDNKQDNNAQQTLTREEARRLAGQLVMIRMPITSLDETSAQFLKDNHIRGICLFRQNMVAKSS